MSDASMPLRLLRTPVYGNWPPIATMGETMLVFLLAVHMLGGIRVLLIANMPWREGQKDLALAALAIAASVAFAFLVGAV